MDSEPRAQELLPIELDAAFRAAHKIPDDVAPVCFRMLDDSMEPTIAPGDLVIINGKPMAIEGRHIVSENLYCIKLNNYTVRRLAVGNGHTHVSAFNKKRFKSYILNGPLATFSPVLAVLPAATSVSLNSDGALVVHRSQTDSRV